jgi:hypothetical protein
MPWPVPVIKEAKAVSCESLLTTSRIESASARISRQKTIHRIGNMIFQYSIVSDNVDGAVRDVLERRESIVDVGVVEIR